MELELAMKLADLSVMEIEEILRNLRITDNSAYEALKEIVDDLS